MRFPTCTVPITVELVRVGKRNILALTATRSMGSPGDLFWASVSAEEIQAKKNGHRKQAKLTDTAWIHRKRRWS